MERLVIGLDIDGVIVDFTTAALPLLSEVCNRHVLPQELFHYDLKECLGIDEKTDNYFWERTLGTELLLHAPPMAGAIDGLSELSRHEIWIITSRPVSLQDITESWLSERQVKYDNIVFVESGDKISAGPRFDVFVEDYLEEARRFAHAGILTLLFNQPWNQAAALPDNCQRVYDWGTIVRLVNGFERES